MNSFKTWNILKALKSKSQINFHVQLFSMKFDFIVPKIIEL